MNIEVVGGGFVNKGDELMAIAVRQKLHSWDPTHRLYMPIRPATLNRRRGQAGIGTVLYLDVNRFGRANKAIRATSRLVPSSRHVVAESKTDIVLDISGFAYGDVWGHQRAARRAETYRERQSRGATVIVMPQAFGPFTDRATGDATRSIVQSATLTFARDDVSEQYLEALGQLPTPVHLAPDFTNLVVPNESDSRSNAPAPVAIVPNARMLDMAGERHAQHYLRFMYTCIEHLADSVGAYILVHEDRDYELAQQLESGTRSKVEIVTEANPLVLKSYLGTSQLVVASRYHALVSSLSQGVPTLGVGWSHKYAALLADYHQSDSLLAVDASEFEIRTRLEKLADPTDSLSTRAQLRRAAEEQRQKSEMMWSTVRAATGL